VPVGAGRLASSHFTQTGGYQSRPHGSPLIDPRRRSGGSSTTPERRRRADLRAPVRRGHPTGYRIRKPAEAPPNAPLLGRARQPRQKPWATVPGAGGGATPPDRRRAVPSARRAARDKKVFRPFRALVAGPVAARPPSGCSVSFLLPWGGGAVRRRLFGRSIAAPRWPGAPGLGRWAPGWRSVRYRRRRATASGANAAPPVPSCRRRAPGSRPRGVGRLWGWWLRSLRGRRRSGALPPPAPPPSLCSCRPAPRGRGRAHASDCDAKIRWGGGVWAAPVPLRAGRGYRRRPDPGAAAARLSGLSSCCGARLRRPFGSPLPPVVAGGEGIRFEGVAPLRRRWGVAALRRRCGDPRRFSLTDLGGDPFLYLAG